MSSFVADTFVCQSQSAGCSTIINCAVISAHRLRSADVLCVLIRDHRRQQHEYTGVLCC